MGRAYLVGIQLPNVYQVWSTDESLKELERLAHTAGLAVGGKTYQQIKRISPATLVGKGKLDDIHREIKITGSDAVIFDEELSPSQQRNLEDYFGEDILVLDRTAVILDIFASHARTREGQLQVELAQYEYRLPRLTRMWTHLARQAGGRQGGVGLRGPGETQLEIDRRRIRSKIRRLKQEISHVRIHREKQREKRRQNNIPVIALVGYTNAGKSTLLKALSDADVIIEDQLFSTLDTTTRRVLLPSGREVLFSDTVGFINKLPHSLVAAFKATFEEIVKADLILHVADSTHPQVLMQRQIVEKEIKSIYKGAGRSIFVWNKIDMDENLLQHHITPGPDTVAVSAKTGKNMDVLLSAVENVLLEKMMPVTLHIPYTEGKLIHSLHKLGSIISMRKEESGIWMIVHIPEKLQKPVKPFIIGENSETHGNHLP